MKKTLLLLVLLSSFSSVLAQIDGAATVAAIKAQTAVLTKQFATLTASVNKLHVSDTKMYAQEVDEIKRLRDEARKLGQIKNYIRDAKMCVSIVRNLNYCREQIGVLRTRVNAIKISSQRKNLEFELNMLLDNGIVLGDLYSSSVSPNVLEINDSGRVDLLYTIYKNSLDFVREVNQVEELIQRISK